MNDISESKEEINSEDDNKMRSMTDEEVDDLWNSVFDSRMKRGGES